MPFASFINAVRSGDTASVRSLAGGHPALLRATDESTFGSTALLAAVNADNRAMVDLLLDLGANIDQRSDWWAGSFGVLDSASDALAAHLLSRGATLTPHAAARLGMIDRLRDMLATDASLVHARGGDGQTPLHFARTVEIADLLLAHHADVNALDIDHASTPAQWLGESRPRVAAHLVSRGATADPFLAARVGDAALLEKLLPLEPDGVNSRVSRERFPTTPPAAGHIYIYTIGEGCSLLHAAAAADQPASIRWLAARGADLAIRGGYDDATPLHIAAWRDLPSAAATLLDVGADINAPSGPTHHNEPLGWAIVSGALNAFRLLLSRQAKIQPWHHENAREGVRGAFRQFNPQRPIEAWQEIAKLLSDA